MYQQRMRKICRPVRVALKKVGRATAAVENPTYDAVDGEIIGSETPQSDENDEGIYATLKIPAGAQLAIPSNNPSADFSYAYADDAYKELTRRSLALVNKDKDVFVPTGSYERAQELFKSHQTVIIRGAPSCGKTAVGLSLLRCLAAEGYDPLVLQTSQEWRNHVRRNRKQSVLLDNVFGQVRVDRSSCVEWLPVFHRLRTLATDNPNCLVVIVLHSHIMAQMERITQPESCFHGLPVVDLDDHPLTTQEKEQMLRKHLATKHIKLEAHAMHEIISRDHSGPLFPLCCGKYITDFSKNRYINQVYDHEVFTIPGLIYVQFFCEALEDCENWKDLVPLLILALNKSGFVLNQDEQMEMKLRILGLVTIDVDMEKLQVWATLLKGSILSSDMEQFRTGDLSDGFSFALVKNQSMGLFLNACDVEFLVKHVHVEPTSKRTDVIIDGTSPFYRNLLQRFCHDILNGNIVQVSQHPALRDKHFLKDFKTFLQEKRCLKAVMLAQDHRHKMPLLYWSAWQSCGSLTNWCLKNLPVKDDGRVTRRAFLVCSLFGEKVNSSRMVRMFKWLCKNKEILNDAVSAVSLPVPAAEDRLCEEVKVKSQRALNGPFLTCGLSGSNDFQNRVCPPDVHEFLPKIMDDDVSPGSPPTVAEVSGSESSPVRNAGVSSSGDATFNQTDSIRHDRPLPPPPAVATVSQLSDVASVFSASSSSSSGSYISLCKGLELLKQANMKNPSPLTPIVEDDGEDAGDSPRGSEHTETPTQTGGDEEGQPRNSNVSSTLSVKSNIMITLTESHVQSGIPLPPSIVKTSVEKEEDKVILQPVCARWYTFLRLVSMCEVDEVNRQGYTLLHTAAFNGELNIVQFLLESGADLASLTKQGNTALTKAMDRNQVGVVSYLLKEGSKALLLSTTTPVAANNSSRDLSWMLGTQNPYDIFSKIVQKRRAQMLCLLFCYGIQPQDDDLESLLMEAASVDDNEEVIRLLEEQRCANRDVEDMEDDAVSSVPEPVDFSAQPENRQK